jgi:hypothetical protein
MLRPTITVAVGLVAAVAASGGAAADDSSYARANARLARATPQYPRAHLLIEERVTGEVGSRPFEAVLRVSRVSRPVTQRAVGRFYARSLGRSWRRRGTACFVSRSRLVVALVSSNRRRLGIVIDTRGATRCAHLAAEIGELMDLGYPDQPSTE